MLKLKRLTIHKFPRVKPGTELVFNDGFNVLLGVNGSGKTTLLKLLEEIFWGSFNANHDDLHVAYRFADGADACDVDVEIIADNRKKAAGREPKNLSRVTFTLADHAPMSVSFRGDRATVVQGKTTVIEPRVEDSHRFAIGAAASQLREALLLDASEEVSVPGEFLESAVRFDESTHWFESGLRAQLPEGERQISMVLLASGAVYPAVTDFFPSEAAEALAGQIRADPERDDYRLDSQHLPMLADISAALGLQDATLHVGLLLRERNEALHHWDYRLGNLRFYFTRTDKTRLMHTELSFGQQRMFAFFYYAAMYPETIIADELTNGMHHSMIASCIDRIGDRQAFLATQSPLLLDNLGFESAEEVRRTFILCSTEQDNGREQMVWRNMTVEESENFYRDYKVGISHVNDILRSWGLW